MLLKPTSLDRKNLLGLRRKTFNQYHLWVKDYTETERQNREMHARWLSRQEAIGRRRLKRRRMVQSCTRAILSCVYLVRFLAHLLVTGVLSTLFYLRHWLGVSASWTSIQARSTAYSLLRLISVASRWVAETTKAVTLAVSATASTTFSLIAIASRTFAVSLWSRLTVVLSWLFVSAPTLALGVSEQPQRLSIELP